MNAIHHNDEQPATFELFVAFAMLGLLASTNWQESGYDPDDLATHSFTYATAVFDKMMERRRDA